MGIHRFKYADGWECNEGTHEDCRRTCVGYRTRRKFQDPSPDHSRIGDGVIFSIHNLDAKDTDKRFPHTLPHPTRPSVAGDGERRKGRIFLRLAGQWRGLHKSQIDTYWMVAAWPRFRDPLPSLLCYPTFFFPRKSAAFNSVSHHEILISGGRQRSAKFKVRS